MIETHLEHPLQRLVGESGAAIGCLSRSSHSVERALRAEIERGQEEIAALRSQIDAIHASASWRLTAPLRTLMDSLRQRSEATPPTPPRGLPPVQAKAARHDRAHPLQLLAYDDDWQRPARTEEHAYRQISARLPADSALEYIAFPWASLIDAVNQWQPDAEYLLAAFLALQELQAPQRRRITVCQHIDIEVIAPYLASAGIADVFYSHARRNDAGRKIGGARIHPFPLFPPQLADPRPANDKDLLFSFVGAQAGPEYLSQIRNWLISDLADTEEGFIRARSSWHYDQAVYGSDTRCESELAAAESEYLDVMARSVFALCPSGSGPNTLRVWEAIGSGVIPVILSDTWLPPGPEDLWRKAAVFWPENRERLPELVEHLRALRATPSRLADHHAAMATIWQRYGPQDFVHDIMEIASTDMPG